MKHLSNLRKRKRSDSVSSGERTRNSPNRFDSSSRGCGTSVSKFIDQPNGLERPAKDRDSRVSKLNDLVGGIPSNAVHVKLRVNLSRPLDKAKYYSATDSELVPRGTGEKNPC